MISYPHIALDTARLHLRPMAKLSREQKRKGSERGRR